VSRKRNTRYPHAFSKGQGVRLAQTGSWRPQAAISIQTEVRGAMTTQGSKPTVNQDGGSVSTPAPEQADGGATNMHALKQSPGGGAPKFSYPIPLDPRRWKVLKVSPTVATLHKGHQGMAIICASCLHGIAHRPPGLPDRFRRQWHLTLLELEKKYRCEMCGERNARIYPWAGDEGADLGLEGPPGQG
jgi:hypothetical protein